MKGLPRSLSRGNPQQLPIVKRRVKIDELLELTGVTDTKVGATAVLGGLPEGNILLLGAVGYLRLAGSGDTDELADDFEGDFSVGTVANADADLSDGGEADILPSTAIGPATDEVSALTRAANATPAILDNTDGSLELNLNVLLDANEVDNGAEVELRATGHLDIAYIVLGDD